MAIAFASAFGRNSGTGTTGSLNSLTTSGSNKLALFFICTGQTISGTPTFGGNNLTQLGHVDTADGTRHKYMYYMVAPPTSGNLSFSLSSSGFWEASGVYYTGVNQTTPFTTANTSTETDTPVNAVDTSEGGGSWHILGCYEDSAATPVSAGSGTTKRQATGYSSYGGGTDLGMIADNNDIVANGVNNTLVVNWTGGGQKMGVIHAMMFPDVAPASANSNFLAFL